MMRVSRCPLFLLSCITFLYGFFVPPFSESLEIGRKTLPNGIPVQYVERTNLPIVHLSLIIRVSPCNDPADREGLASMTAMMLTEGTEKRNSRQISEETEFIGASLGASAGPDYTAINLSVLKKDLAQGIDLFLDILLNPVFPAEELARKKNLVKGSLKQMEEEPMYLARKAFLKEVYGSSAYGRPAQGSAESIDRLAREDLVSFHRSYYRPDNAFLTAVGDLGEPELGEFLNALSSRWKKDERTAPPASSAGCGKLSIPGERPVLKTIDRDVTQANIMLGHRGIPRDHPDYYAVTVMNYILGGGGFSSRLMQTVRDEMGLAYSIYSHFTPHRHTGHFAVEVQTKNESASVVVREILRQMKRMQTEMVSDQELDDAKAYLTGSFPRRLESGRQITDFLGSAEFFGLGADYITKYPSYIRTITKEDIRRVAGLYLHPGAYILSVTGNPKRLPPFETETVEK